MQFTQNVVIGLEIHVQLNTNTKLFCSCPTSANEPNKAICPTCLGHPGTKPTTNKKAIEYGTKLALALGCKIAPTITFSRKTYFYPDLPKNFQTTQYKLPLGSEGKLTLQDGFEVGIERVHLEEDPGALIHDGANVLIDYNRSGIPLCEIVTKPQMQSPAQARDFMKKLLRVIGYLGVFDINTCTIKADANVSIKEKNYTRVEIKNVGSFKEIERALLYEIARQKEQDVVLETRGWSAEKGKTYSMRKKETEADYGYIVESDLPVFDLEKEWVEKIKATIPELGEFRSSRWVKELKIDKDDANIIAANIEVAAIFEEIAKKIDPVFSARWVRREVLRVLNDKKKTLSETALTTENLVELFTLITSGKINDRIGQQIIGKLAQESFNVTNYVEENNLTMVCDTTELKEICQKIVDSNQKAVTDYNKGEQKALQFLIGQVMRETKGKAKPQILKEIFKSILD